MFSICDTSPNRREFLRVGSLALGGLTLPWLLSRANAAPSRKFLKDRSVVLLFLQGGPPQIETFDPKMDAPDGIRSITGEVKTNVPGITIGGTFPKLARHMDKLAIVRSFSVSKGGPAHEAGYTQLLVAGNPLDATMGSLYARAAGPIHPKTGMPTNAIILPEAVDPGLKLGQPSGAFTLNQTLKYFATAGKLGSDMEPFNPSGGSNLLSNLQLKLPRDRFDDRRSLLEQIDTFKKRSDSPRELEGMDGFQRQAYDVLLRGVSQAFDLSKEDAKTVAKYDTSRLFDMEKYHKGGRGYRPNYSRSSNLLGKQMLLARRLCEAGCGFVTVVDSCWDFHADGNNPPVEEGMTVLSPQADHAITAFLEDVHDRGLEDKILLVITAEMGRTPKKSNKGGSGHWGELAPLVLAGGGLKVGQVIGRSDRNGGQPATERYTPANLLGTIMHTLFDVGELRITDGVAKSVSQSIVDPKPIAELF